MQKVTPFLLALLFFAISLPAQKKAVVEGQVFNSTNKEPLAFATVTILERETGTTCDSAGFFHLELDPGLYNLEASYLGYYPLILHEVNASTGKPVFLEVFLDPATTDLKQVEVRAEAFRHTAESPLALQSVTLHELERMPGATIDISRFIRTLPGVSPRTSFGYNLIVRGGASIENRFYLDGVEIPTITHFTVQGTSGGPNGMLNVRMLQRADMHTGAFPAGRPNALSSVLEIYQREGRKDRVGGNFTLGATDYGFLVEGPIGKKSNFMVSARESYSQHMFKAIGIPVLPFYSDVQFKNVIRFNPKNELILTGIGGYDKYTLNLGAKTSESLLYNTGYIPEGKQLIYTVGAVYKHYLDNSYYTLVLSRNGFINQAEKFLGNTYKTEDQILDFKSGEMETKLRLEQRLFRAPWEFNYGVNGELDQVHTDNYSLFTFRDGSNDTVAYNSEFRFIRYGAFVSANRSFAGERVSLFAGVRLDGNTYSTSMQNPFPQFSPRLALSWKIADNWQLNASSGMYYQLPPYILMGYMQNGELVNRDRLDYMRSKQVGLGIDHTTGNGYQVKLEGFYKAYDQYPFLLFDSISYANANASYVLIGNQPANASSSGRAYGIEFQVKQKLTHNYYWMLNYSFVVSQFRDAAGNLISSSWDNRHFGTIAVGKTFRKKWEMGLRWSFSGGNPYTPYDLALSSQRAIWDVNRRGLPDYSRLNGARLPFFHQLDFRVDKQFNFRKWALQLYLDIQNVYSAPITLLPYLTVERDAENNPIVDPNDPSRYLVKTISSDTGRVLPSVGILLDL
ncbi:MAG: TonB-dependent receptor [Lewinellaceae bacterium]|nr:TonB-dependent receptor [Lewinellaceae bacterium]